jgi:hypothetical protein
METQLLMTFNGCLRCQVGHRLEGAEKFGTAIRITGIIERIDANVSRRRRPLAGVRCTRGLGPHADFVLSSSWPEGDRHKRELILPHSACSPVPPASLVAQAIHDLSAFLMRWSSAIATSTDILEACLELGEHIYHLHSRLSIEESGWHNTSQPVIHVCK